MSGEPAIGGEAHFSYEPRDLAQMQRAWWMGAARWQTFFRTFLILALIYAAMFVGINLAFGSPPLDNVKFAVGIALVVALLIYLAGFVLGPLLGPRALKQNKLLAGEYFWRWDAERLTISHEHSEVRVPYALYHAWLDAPKALLLYQSPRLVHMLPKRAADPRAVAGLIAALRAAGTPERKRFGFLGAPADGTLGAAPAGS